MISIAALTKTSNAFSNFPYWKQSLLNMLIDKTVVVLGYSCSDDFDVYPILKLSQLKKIIWLNYNENHSYPQQCETIDNKNFKDLSNVLSLLYYEGQLILFKIYLRFLLFYFSKKSSISTRLDLYNV